MATTKKSAKPADEGFLTTAAQAIGSTLGQLAKKAGVASPTPGKAAPKKKRPPIVKKAVKKAVKKVAKKKAVAKKKK